MGTATREVGQDSLTPMGVSGNHTAELASLRVAVASDQIIYANDLNRIGAMINNMNGHYHTYTDLYQNATFGNNGDRSAYTESKNTAGPDHIVAAPTNTAANTTITASRHNELKDSINAIRYHYHEINDRTS
jgi:hypothetical protein